MHVQRFANKSEIVPRYAGWGWGVGDDGGPLILNINPHTIRFWFVAKNNVFPSLIYSFFSFRCSELLVFPLVSISFVKHSMTTIDSAWYFVFACLFCDFFLSVLPFSISFYFWFFFSVSCDITVCISKFLYIVVSVYLTWHDLVKVACFRFGFFLLSVIFILLRCIKMYFYFYSFVVILGLRIWFTQFARHYLRPWMWADLNMP